MVLVRMQARPQLLPADMVPGLKRALQPAHQHSMALALGLVQVRRRNLVDLVPIPARHHNLVDPVLDRETDNLPPHLKRVETPGVASRLNLRARGVTSPKHEWHWMESDGAPTSVPSLYFQTM